MSEDEQNIYGHELNVLPSLQHLNCSYQPPLAVEGAPHPFEIFSFTTTRFIDRVYLQTYHADARPYLHFHSRIV